ncbi:hypothetical protein DFH06DRAFT_1141822 [Mycena polygramma]|nr:hypothetical protein DFH06DRAFT_1141822 [Mycena polygramma]
MRDLARNGIRTRVGWESGGHRIREADEQKSKTARTPETEKHILRGKVQVGVSPRRRSFFNPNVVTEEGVTIDGYLQNGDRNTPTVGLRRDVSDEKEGEVCVWFGGLVALGGDRNGQVRPNRARGAAAGALPPHPHPPPPPPSSPCPYRRGAGTGRPALGPKYTYPPNNTSSKAPAAVRSRRRWVRRRLRREACDDGWEEDVASASSGRAMLDSGFGCADMAVFQEEVLEDVDARRFEEEEGEDTLKSSLCAVPHVVDEDPPQE